MKVLVTVLVLVVALVGVLSQLSPYIGQEISSSVYRTSPYGRCDSNARLRPTLPCFKGGNGPFTFPSTTISNSTVPKISSLLGMDIAGVRTLYVGNPNLIQVVRPNQPFGNSTTVTGVTIQNFTTSFTPNGPFVGSFSDGATYVAFVNSAGLVAKFPMFADGTLNATGAVTLVTGITNPTTLVTTALPIVVIAGSATVAVVDIAALTVNVTAITLPNGQTGTINCGVAVSTDSTILYFSTSSGQVFSFNRVLGVVINSIAITNDLFSRSCAARPGLYAVFFSTIGNVYQVAYSTGNLANASYISAGVGIQGTAQIVGVSATNADNSAVYVVTYTPGGSSLYLDTIYEFRLYDETYDFSAVIQEDQASPLVFWDPTTISPLVGQSLYIGASGSQIPRVYELFVPSTYNLTGNPNATLPSHLVPDYSLPRNPTGPEGKLNSIGDVTRTLTNGDLIFANGVGLFPTVTNDTTSSIPSRGPIVTYIRGTQTEAPNHGGSPNVNGISLKLVSLDEVSTTASGGINVVKTMPFYNTADAPWVRDSSQNQYQNGQTAGVTGITWTSGLTNTVDLAANNYNYLVPPYAVPVNGSIPRRNRVPTKRSPQGPNQNTNGYVGMTVTLSTYSTNATMAQVAGVNYNVSSRTFLYQFSIINYPFRSNNFLRLNIAVGLGIDGNTSLGATVLGANTTLAPLIPGYVISTESADWTLLLPQSATVNFQRITSPYNCSYDISQQIISAYLPFASANSTIQYLLALEYDYVSPPPISPDNQDGGGPKLLPLWIVIGVVGGLVIIAIIIAIIVIIVVYKVAGDKIKAWIVDSQFDQTEGALREDRGPF
eukprot:TRINITY_DN22517_c0_g1_i1.p1 TRINITY_DN22517_c0_g1~~TRINITY_DN22517_c0_g1_i1.p1  ORF type:complete len:830 (+),score=171.48 TRINITY_DN22517_c0_g1_i1:55-2544(+)